MRRRLRLARKLVVTETAQQDLDEIDAYVAQRAPQAAIDLLDAILAKCLSLTNFPLRHPVAPESAEYGFEMRHVIVKSYRVLYAVEPGSIVVVRIGHGARRSLSPGER